MKSFIRKSSARILAIFMVLSIVSPLAFAAEISSNDEQTPTLIPIEEAGISREEALATFGISEEESDGLVFFTLDSSTDIGYGIHDLGTFTFTDSNIGVYRTYNVRSVMIKIQYKPKLDANGGHNQYMYVEFEQYGGKIFWYSRLIVAGQSSIKELSNGFYEFPASDWINIDKGVDYRFRYYLRDASNGSTTGHTASVRVIVAGSTL